MVVVKSVGKKGSTLSQEDLGEAGRRMNRRERALKLAIVGLSSSRRHHVALEGRKQQRRLRPKVELSCSSLPSASSHRINSPRMRQAARAISTDKALPRMVSQCSQEH